MNRVKQFILISASLGFMACTNADSPEPQNNPIATNTEANSQTGSPMHDSWGPEITEYMPQPAILVFSKTNEWRHNEGIAGGDHFFVSLAREKGFGIYTTANGSVFHPDTLARFKVVVFNNMTGDTLNKEQEKAFRNWLENGGAWMGLHGAGDSSHMDWDWYQNELIGPTFISHPMAPQFQDARVVNLAPEHPIMAGVPTDFIHNDEWYTFDSTAQSHGHTPLAGLDETTYSPRNTVYGVEDLRMGEGAINHPIIWSHCPGQGRAFYSAIGHLETNYNDPNYARILDNAFDWVRGKTDKNGTACPEK